MTIEDTTPETTVSEWIELGIAEMIGRLQAIDPLTRYYLGDHPNPKATPAAVAEHRRLLAMSRTNWCELIVDAVAERLAVVGFEPGGVSVSDTSTETPIEWRIWQDNRMDADHKLVHRDALALRSSFVLVWPDRRMPNGVAITPEHPTQCVVLYEDGSRRHRAAAMKVWHTRANGGRLFLTMYLPDGVYKFQSVSTAKEDSGLDTFQRAEAWQPRSVPGETWPLPNPFRGEVPMIEFVPTPRTLGWGRSEFEGVVDIIDRINTTTFNRLLAAEYSAFRQKWVTGLEVIRGADGKPVEPFNVAVNRLLVGEDPETRFGEFGESDLSNYIRSIEADVNHMAAITKTPPHYLLGSMVQVSGDALTAAEAGLTLKVAERAQYLGESWEEVLRLAVSVTPLAEGSEPDVSSQVVWGPFERRNEGQLVDALVKMDTLGVPREILWQRWGASPQDIRKWSALAARKALMAALTAPAATPVAQAPAAGATEAPTGPGGPTPALPGSPASNATPRPVA